MTHMLSYLTTWIKAGKASTECITDKHMARVMLEHHTTTTRASEGDKLPFSALTSVNVDGKAHVISFLVY